MRAFAGSVQFTDWRGLTDRVLDPLAIHQECFQLMIQCVIQMAHWIGADLDVPIGCADILMREKVAHQEGIGPGLSSPAPAGVPKVV